MQIHHGWRGLPATARGASVVLGNFDGVHLGHAHLLRAAHAARPDLDLAVLTFEPHPREFFRPEDPPFRLTDASGRAAALAALGVRHLYEIPFTAEFAATEASDFITEVLYQGIGARHLTCGPDFAFGRRRGGDASFLARQAELLDMGLTLVPKLADAQGPLSSTRIRRALQDAYPERANAELGRPWSVRGVVATGQRLGHTIGFPTANIGLGRLIEPARGVYAVRVRLVDGSTHGGVANIGHRPTVNAGFDSRLEAHLFDFDADLYGQEIEVALLAYLRAEQRFPDLAALTAQINEDARAARSLLLALPAPGASA